MLDSDVYNMRNKKQKENIKIIRIMTWKKISRKRVTIIRKMEINMKGSDSINYKNERSYKNDSHNTNSSNNWKNINRDEQNLNDRSGVIKIVILVN